MTRLSRESITTILSITLLIAGLTCFAIKAGSTEYVDGTGVLHEQFFLLPLGFFLILMSIVSGVGAVLLHRRSNRME